MNTEMFLYDALKEFKLDYRSWYFYLYCIEVSRNEYLDVWIYSAIVSLL